jgi:hypothetical protein
LILPYPIHADHGYHTPQEFDRLESQYQKCLEDEVENFISKPYFVAELSSSFSLALQKSYAITGDEMEVRILDSDLVRAVTAYAGENSSHMKSWSDQMTSTVYELFVYQIASIIATEITYAIGFYDNTQNEEYQSIKFTEWGALLLYEEVSSHLS